MPVNEILSKNSTFISSSYVSMFLLRNPACTQRYDVPQPYDKNRYESHFWTSYLLQINFVLSFYFTKNLNSYNEPRPVNFSEDYFSFDPSQQYFM